MKKIELFTQQYSSPVVWFLSRFQFHGDRQTETETGADEKLLTQRYSVPVVWFLSVYSDKQTETETGTDEDKWNYYYPPSSIPSLKSDSFHSNRQAGTETGTDKVYIYISI